MMLFAIISACGIQRHFDYWHLNVSTRRYSNKGFSSIHQVERYLNF